MAKTEAVSIVLHDIRPMTWKIRIAEIIFIFVQYWFGIPGKSQFSSKRHVKQRGLGLTHRRYPRLEAQVVDIIAVGNARGAAGGKIYAIKHSGRICAVASARRFGGRPDIFAVHVYFGAAVRGVVICNLDMHMAPFGLFIHIGRHLDAVLIREGKPVETVEHLGFMLVEHNLKGLIGGKCGIAGRQRQGYDAVFDVHVKIKRQLLVPVWNLIVHVRRVHVGIIV